jgi:hypothetical protein
LYAYATHRLIPKLIETLSVDPLNPEKCPQRYFHKEVKAGKEGNGYKLYKWCNKQVAAYI